VEAAAAGLEPWLRVTPGRCTWDLRPGFHWHKGSAAQWLQRRLQFEDALVICLGDDTTDEDLFQAYPHGVTIKVHSPSPPGDARQESNCNGTHARFQVALPADVQSFLAWLLDLRRRESRENPRDRQRSALVQGRHFL
jgi:trehalose-phosphatase